MFACFLPLISLVLTLKLIINNALNVNKVFFLIEPTGFTTVLVLVLVLAVLVLTVLVIVLAVLVLVLAVLVLVLVPVLVASYSDAFRIKL